MTKNVPPHNNVMHVLIPNRAEVMAYLRSKSVDPNIRNQVGKILERGERAVREYCSKCEKGDIE